MSAPQGPKESAAAYRARLGKKAYQHAELGASFTVTEEQAAEVATMKSDFPVGAKKSKRTRKPKE